jgi:hypothetical protein
MVRFTEDPNTDKPRQCRKSVIRHKLEEHFGYAFNAGHRGTQGWVKSDSTNIIVLDMLQYIKAIVPGDGAGFSHQYAGFEETVSGTNYAFAVGYLKSIILKVIEESSESRDDKRIPLVVVVGIDKYDYTCPARKIVHHTRAQNKEIFLKPGEFEFPSLTDAIEFPFDEITSDKKINSKVLFQFLSYNILQLLMDTTFDREIMFVFEGHCIDKELCLASGVIPPPRSPYRSYKTPIFLLANGSEKEVNWLYSFENMTGETDFLSLFYLKYASVFTEFWKSEDSKQLWSECNPKVLDIYSTDTDSVLYSMIYLDINREGPQENQINVMYSRLSKKPEWIPKWCFSHVLLNEVSSKIGQRAKYRIEYPGLQLAIAGLAGGSDYTEPHVGIPHQHFVQTLLEYPELIGNLVTVQHGEDKNFYNLIINGASYVKFICLVHYVSRRKYKLWDDYNPNDPGKLTYKYVSEHLIKKYNENDKYWLPSREDLQLQACQLQYYLNMLSRLGEYRVDIELQDSDLTDYGYERLEGTNRVIRKVSRYTEDEIDNIISSMGCNRKKPRKKKNEISDADGFGVIKLGKKRSSLGDMGRGKKKKSEPVANDEDDIEDFSD